LPVPLLFYLAFGVNLRQVNEVLPENIYYEIICKLANRIALPEKKSNSGPVIEELVSG
jgi:hypothetical protein